MRREHNKVETGGGGGGSQYDDNLLFYAPMIGDPTDVIDGTPFTLFTSLYDASRGYSYTNNYVQSNKKLFYAFDHNGFYSENTDPNQRTNGNSGQNATLVYSPVVGGKLYNGISSANSILVEYDTKVYYSRGIITPFFLAYLAGRDFTGMVKAGQQWTEATGLPVNTWIHLSFVYQFSSNTTSVTMMNNLGYASKTYSLGLVGTEYKYMTFGQNWGSANCCKFHIKEFKISKFS